MFSIEKASHAKQHKKSTQSGEFYMILIVFHGGHVKSKQKATQDDEKKSTQNCQIWRPSGARIALSFGSGRPAQSIIKSTKKTENVKASARIWTSFSFRRTSKRIEQKPILRWNSHQNPWCKTTALSQNSLKNLLRE